MRIRVRFVRGEGSIARQLEVLRIMSRSSSTAVVYLHGFPGGPGELELVPGAEAWRSGIHVPDRTDDRPDLAADAYFDALAGDMSARFSGRKLHLIGFSLGARVALELAARLGEAIDHIDLISPAGPLDGSDHRSLMAGEAVFKLAASSKPLFGLHSAIQARLALAAPGFVFRTLFSTAKGGDAALRANDHFQVGMGKVLRQCFELGGSGYRREVAAYVRPWADRVPKIAAPTTIWAGDADNWTPIVMAERLAHLLPHASLRTLAGASHYSALIAALGEIFGADAQ